jgi:hypothetical protein
MKRRLSVSAAFFAGMVLIYILGAFIQNDPVSGNWSSGARMVVVLFGLIAGAVLALMIDAQFDKDK